MDNIDNNIEYNNTKCKVNGYYFKQIFDIIISIYAIYLAVVSKEKLNIIRLIIAIIFPYFYIILHIIIYYGIKK